MTEVSTSPNLQAAIAGPNDKQPASENGGEQPAAPGVQNYTDGYSYEVPRPFLTLHQAASVLGMTLRSIERSVLGRWGNKLPEGWLARRLKTGENDEWRILPPPGFRVKLNTATECDTETEAPFVPNIQTPPAPFAGNSPEAQRSPAGGQQTAVQPGDALGYYMSNHKRTPKAQWRPERHTVDQPTIIIDRTEEVEHLLRELVATKSALAEERRVHLDDMRMITQMQGSMRLLEVNAADQVRMKIELEAAKNELQTWQLKYDELTSRPWWRRLLNRK